MAAKEALLCREAFLVSRASIQHSANMVYHELPASLTNAKKTTFAVESCSKQYEYAQLQGQLVSAKLEWPSCFPLYLSSLKHKYHEYHESLSIFLSELFTSCTTSDACSATGQP